MDVEMIYDNLKKNTFQENICCKAVEIGIEEETLLQVLKDTVDTSWGKEILDGEKIENWLSNFKGRVFEREYERKLALLLAINIVYYNEKDICYLVKVAYKKLLHDIMIKEKLDIEAVARSIVFLPLGSISESGPFLSYYFRKENNLSIDFFAQSVESIRNISEKRNIVFLDDVSITGGQANWYIGRLKKKQELWEQVLHEKKFYALFLISTSIVQKKLKKEGIHLCSPIVMDERSQCFNEKSVIYKIFDKKIRNIIRVQSKYMAQKYGYDLLVEHYRYNGELFRILEKGKKEEEIRQKIVNDALGYNDSEVLIAFEYNTPNNSLPIIWGENNGWKPLFKRYDKLYAAQVVGGIENETMYI